MHRALTFLAAVALLLAITAPVAAKGRPEIVPLEPSMLDEDFLAGTCDFRAELVDLSSNSKLMFFPLAADGSALVRSTGGYVSTLTNLDTEESITLRYYSKIDFDARPDGSTVVHTSGSVFLFVFEGDTLSRFEPGLYLVTGMTRAVVDANGFATGPELVRGKVRDLCAELAPD